MGKEYECGRLLRAIVSESEQTSYVCIVTAVNGATCDVKRIQNNKEIKEVRLNATLKENDGLVIIPKKDSTVLVTHIDGNKYFVSQFSEIEKITLNVKDKIEINGGTFGGMVKIEALNNRLKNLEQAFNNHTHIISAEDGVAAAGMYTVMGNIPAVIEKSNEFQEGYSEYENEKITH